jgi:hypothetical protein
LNSQVDLGVNPPDIPSTYHPTYPKMVAEVIPKLYELEQNIKEKPERLT